MRAYRKNNLVFVPLYKNAATTYEHFFGYLLKWESILTENIDWNSDKVFSYISNPITRHIKGTVEFLTLKNLQHLVDHPDFRDIFVNGFFDHHTMPISILFGDKKDLIYWMPIDHPTTTSEELTGKFLASHGVSIDISKIKRYHSSPAEKKELEQKIQKTFNEIGFTKDNFGFYFLLDDDIIFYNKVMQSL